MNTEQDELIDENGKITASGQAWEKVASDLDPPASTYPKDYLLDPDQSGPAIWPKYEGMIEVSAWELIVLAQHWTQVFSSYRACLSQTCTRFWMFLEGHADRRTYQLENALALRLHQMCDDIEAEHKEAADEDKLMVRYASAIQFEELLRKMSNVWNLAPVSGLQWNSHGWVPKFRLARAVRRATLLTRHPPAEEDREAAQSRFRHKEGFEWDSYNPLNS